MGTRKLRIYNPDQQIETNKVRLRLSPFEPRVAAGSFVLDVGLRLVWIVGNVRSALVSVAVRRLRVILPVLGACFLLGSIRYFQTR